MKSLSIVSLALVVLLGSAVGLCAAESETFTGTAAASGTYKRPQLLVDGKRYELKASDKADASVAVPRSALLGRTDEPEAFIESTSVQRLHRVRLLGASLFPTAGVKYHR
jgi:hypothetical protein